MFEKKNIKKASGYLKVNKHKLKTYLNAALVAWYFLSLNIFFY